MSTALPLLRLAVAAEVAAGLGDCWGAPKMLALLSVAVGVVILNLQGAHWPS
ncbi:hypothetical protein [Nocardioides eburneiflavus]|uniref:hypothetical protein n=1 Tax=Nocardioides eburneiflavus TaxID=2518372 RepID=UPI00143CEB20|nr:hypothetical protein [Nocardioides eburneiflavus]